MATVQQIVTDRAIAAGHQVLFINETENPPGTFNRFWTFAEGATQQQIADANAFLAAIDWVAEQAAIDAAIADAAFSRANIIERADDILAEEVAGQAAATADLATIASGKAAVIALPGTVPAALKNILTGMLNVMERDINRSKDHMKATADVVKLVRHLAEG